MLTRLAQASSRRAPVGLAALFVAALSRCITTPPAPDLERVFILEAQADLTEIRVGESVLVTFTLRNTSPAPIDTCIETEGVSVRLRSPDGKYTFPITSFGTRLHTVCAIETRFEPGEARTYRQRVFVLSNFAAERAVFEGTLPLRQHPRFRTGPGETYFTLRKTVELLVKP